LRRITEPTTEQKSLLHQLAWSYLSVFSSIANVV
jgi:hypothetical protein